MPASGVDFPLDGEILLPRAGREDFYHKVGRPGNVRELENKLRRAVIMATEKQITQQDLSLAGPYAEYEAMGLNKAREAMERDLIARALARNQSSF